MRLEAFSNLPRRDARPRAWLRPEIGAGVAVLAIAAMGPSLAMAQSPAAPVATLGGPDKPFTVGVQEITGYESNPARGNAVDAASRHLRGDDVTLSPSITAVYSRSEGLQGLALSANFGYDYHIRNDILSREHLDFSVVGNRAVGAFCSVGGQGQFNRAQSDLEYLTVDVTKNTLQTYTIDLSESCSNRAGLTESVIVSRSGSQNSSPELVDFGNTGASVLLGYTNSTIGTAGVTLSYNRTDYEHASNVQTETPDQMEVESVGLQLSRPIGARLSGTASVSLSHSDERLRLGAPNLGQSTFNGMTYSAGLTYAAGPRLALSTEIAHQVSASILAGVGYSVVTKVSGAAQYTVSSRISASLGASWSRYDYHGLDPLFQQTTPTWQDLTTVYGKVSMAVGRRASVSLDVRHLIGRAGLALYDFTSNYAGLTLATSF